MSTESVAPLRESAVTEVKKSTTKPVEAAAPTLARASESGDAGVHNLLAQRTIHASNGHDEQVAEIDRQLAELGLTAQ